VRLALHFGSTLVLCESWDPAEVVGTIAAERCTYLVGATRRMLTELLDEADSSAVDITSLRSAVCAGATADLIERADRIGLSLARVYGATEALVVTRCRGDDPRYKRVHTDGLPLPEMEFEIRTADGELAEPGEIGEIYVRGPSVCVGYLEDPARNSSTFDATGWFRTGDLGTKDPDGFLKVGGRKSELMLRNGRQILPNEVEEQIRKLDSVVDVALVLVSADGTAEVCACLVLKSGVGQLSLDEITSHLLAGGVPRASCPDRLEIFADLPLTATGKVRRDALVAALLDERVTR
jgi:acyl-CoA synthetase (AMP-forming)/AMP-acid ligase II